MGGGQAGAGLGSEPEGRPPGVLEAVLGTSSRWANLLALDWELDALMETGSEMESRQTGDRPWDLTVPGRDQLCRVLGERSRAREEAARAQTSAQFRNTFSTSF